MTSIDQYAKQYLTKRRTTPQYDTYHLIIFPSDNSFSVVKSKHCTAAEHNGIVMVQSGGKKYSGFIVQTGSLDICSKAADSLSKKQHEGIESDYERNVDGLSRKENIDRHQDISSIKSLADVAFSIGDPLSEHNQSSQPRNDDLVTKNGHVETNHKIFVDKKKTKSWEKAATKKVDKPSVENASRIPQSITTALTQIDCSASTHEDRNTIEHYNTTSEISFTVRNDPRTEVDIAKKITRKKRNDRQSQKKKNSLASSSTSSSPSSSDPEAEEVELASQINRDKTPSFTGRSISVATIEKRMIQDESTVNEKWDTIENKYLTPLLIGQQRLEKMMKSLYANQVKIQKALHKRQMNLSLEEPGRADSNDHSFPSKLTFLTDDNLSIDLLKIPASKEKANLYVTAMIQRMFTMEELVELNPVETHNDKRYQLIREAVRCKFRLSDEELDQLFNTWLRDVFLAKRRIAVAKMKANKFNK